MSSIEVLDLNQQHSAEGKFAQYAYRAHILTEEPVYFGDIRTNGVIILGNDLLELELAMYSFLKECSATPVYYRIRDREGNLIKHNDEFDT